MHGDWPRAALSLPRDSAPLAVVPHLADTPLYMRSVCPVCATCQLPPAGTSTAMPVVVFVLRVAATGNKTMEAFRTAKRTLLHAMLADLVAPLPTVRPSVASCRTWLWWWRTGRKRSLTLTANNGRCPSLVTAGPVGRHSGHPPLCAVLATPTTRPYAAGRPGRGTCRGG
jgi:hypothetical protein